ncbi:zinc finger homeobox protein 3 [Limosa lapponica baueri]|uniref:Zinc finger homeobox protein 3 n=1 Tax=Limosa lapponica baueri TaxID=1758121 RepID=A0A2I0U151_LIMLA|nr:zinc finger homeobox protein 3 [Limosa lapponica baueri]
MPTDDYSEESDTDLSQKSDGPASPAEGPRDPGCPKDSGLASVGMDTFRFMNPGMPLEDPGYSLRGMATSL